MWSSRAVHIFTILSFSLSPILFSYVSSSQIVERTFREPTDSSFKYPICESGYYDIGDLTGSRRMFYYFVEEISDKTSPIILWLTGVPGLTSSISLFHENGPYKINDNLKLISREYGWDKVAKVIYVDEPIGTGFSYINDSSQIRDNKKQVIDDLYNFLQKFFLQHHDYRESDFFLTGQSYAGKYAPMLAYKIYEGNKNTQSNIYIHLKGVAIGGGLTNPRKQFSKIPKFVKDMKLIAEKDQLKIDKASKVCQLSARKCDKTGSLFPCLTAYSDCGILLQLVTNLDGGKNIYDITKESVGILKYDYSDVESYLSLESVKEALGADIRPFQLFNKDVYDALLADYMRNSQTYVADLLDLGINVLIYAGEYDLLTNINGIRKWLTELIWDGDEEFEDAEDEPFLVESKNAGLLREYGPLRLVLVFKAGHMVAMDQPKVVFTMIKDWMKHIKETTHD